VQERLQKAQQTSFWGQPRIYKAIPLKPVKREWLSVFILEYTKLPPGT
jgi:hypothetical protein